MCKSQWITSPEFHKPVQNKLMTSCSLLSRYTTVRWKKQHTIVQIKRRKSQAQSPGPGRYHYDCTGELDPSLPEVVSLASLANHSHEPGQKPHTLKIESRALGDQA